MSVNNTRETVRDISVVFGQCHPVGIMFDYTEDTVGAVTAIRERNKKVPIVIFSRLPHMPIEKFVGLDVKYCPKYLMPPEKFLKEILRRFMPR